MTRLAVFERPGLAPPREIVFARGSIAPILQQEYPEGFGQARPRYYVTSPGFATQEIEAVRALERDYKPSDVIYCLLQPKGPVGVAIGLAIAAIVVGLMVFSKIAPARRSVADDSDDQSDAAPDLKRQNQLVRVGTRVPDMFGENRVYPSLATPGYVVHVGEKQELTELFVLGEGHHKITEPKLGDTPLSDLDHAAMTVFSPNERLPKDIRVVQYNKNVSRLLLRSPDDALKQQDVWFDASNRRLSFSTKIHKPLHKAKVFQVLGSTNNDGYYEAVDRGGSDPYWVQVAQSLQNESSTGVYFELPEREVEPELFEGVQGYPIKLIGDKMIAALEYETTLPDGSVTSYKASLAEGKHYTFDSNNRFNRKQRLKVKSINYGSVYLESRGVVSKIRTISVRFEQLDGSKADLRDKDIKWDDRKSQLQIKPLKFKEGLDTTTIGNNQNWTDWYTVGSDDRPITEIWWTYGFPNGLWKQSAGEEREEEQIDIDVEYQRMVNGSAVGSREVDQINVEEETRLQMRYTEKYTNLESGQWRIRWRRRNLTRNDEADKYYSDETRIYDLAGARKIERGQFNKLTTLVLRLRGGDEIGSITDRRLNVVQKRMLNKLNKGGELSSQRKTTRRMIDALVHVATTDGRYSAGHLDLAGMADLQHRLDQMDGGDQGTFSHVFRQTMSVDDELQTIADAARCVVYRIGSRLYIARREAKAEPGSALFCRRNMLWENYRRSMSFSSSNDPQAITIKWRDRSNDYRDREYTYPEKLRGRRAKRITIPGIDNWAQAYRRARFEHAMLSYATDKLSITTTEEGQLVEPFALVRVEDVLLQIFRSGEVIEYDEITQILTLDREVQFSEKSLDYSIVLRARDGMSCEEIRCTAVAGQPAQVLCESAVQMKIVGDGHQVRTLFCFGPERGHIAERWTVEEARPLRGKVRLALSRYDVRAFEGDTVKLPPVPSL